jgi:thiol-disulfide isomerase/thioredoxin
MRLAAVIFIGWVIVAACERRSVAPVASPPGEDLKGRPAPVLSLKTLDGKAVSSAALRGHVVVVDFWATWCIPCRESLPHLQELAADKKLAGEGLLVLAVNAGEDAPSVKSFLEKNGYTFTVPLDQDGQMMRAFHADALPTTVVIGRNGIVRQVIEGFDPTNGGAELRTAVQAALKQSKPPEP